MGVAYAWEKMSRALDSLAMAPEALPARLKHALFPHFMNALHDAELVLVICRPNFSNRCGV